MVDKKKGVKKIPRGRPDDTIEDLHADDMVGSEAWTKPRRRKKKTSP